MKDKILKLVVGIIALASMTVASGAIVWVLKTTFEWLANHWAVVNTILWCSVLTFIIGAISYSIGDTFVENYRRNKKKKAKGNKNGLNTR
jgi:hypothetical protein